MYFCFKKQIAYALYHTSGKRHFQHHTSPMAWMDSIVSYSWSKITAVSEPLGLFSLICDISVWIFHPASAMDRPGTKEV
jgi:hypothetical protein